jgi:uncharacterized BrkB/YihY/UPF0761 family membrane protein
LRTCFTVNNLCMGSRVAIGLLMALLLGGGLILAALAPGVGLILFLGIVVLVVLIGAAAFASGSRRREPRKTELLGPGGPDDPDA